MIAEVSSKGKSTSASCVTSTFLPHSPFLFLFPFCSPATATSCNARATSGDAIRATHFHPLANLHRTTSQERFASVGARRATNGDVNSRDLTFQPLATSIDNEPRKIQRSKQPNLQNPKAQWAVSECGGRCAKRCIRLHRWQLRHARAYSKRMMQCFSRSA